MMTALRRSFLTWDAKALRRAALWLLLSYTAIVLTLWCFERSLVFVPSKYPKGDWTLPAHVEDVNFTSSDGTALNGWYFPAEKPKAFCLFSHGNGGNLTNRWDIAEALRTEAACSVFLYDYRGYGKSQGSPSEQGILQDARAARDWLAAREKIPPTQILQIGESLGGGVAVDVASKEGARGLLLIGTFSTLPDAAAHHFSFVPVRWIMRTRLNSIDKIVHYHGPLLQFHWDHDNVVPYALGKRLHAAANQPKMLFTGSGQDHRDPPPYEFYTQVKDWVEKLPAAE